METYFLAEVELMNKKGYLAETVTQRCFAEKVFWNIW